MQLRPMVTSALSMLQALAFLSVALVTVRFAAVPMPRFASAGTVSLQAFTVPAQQASRAWFVSPAGRASNPGTRERPWDLQTALHGGGRVAPGDTVWILEGRYEGTEFTTTLRGTPQARITFRAWPGHRATIDGRLLARGSHLDFWGLEIMQSRPLQYPGEMQLLDIRTDHGRFINLVLHDANTHGANFWTPGIDAELYGSIVHNNGTHENLDHGIYVHNEHGTKRVLDNVFFNNYGRGIQVYASRRNGVLRNVHVEGNIAFNNGVPSARSTRVNLLFNAQVPVDSMAAVDNLLFYSPDAGGINLRAGHVPQRYRGLTISGNYIVGGRAGLELGQPWADAIVRGNTFLSWPGSATLRGPGSAAATVRDNRELTPRALREPLVVVRPNRYERGRAHIAVLNTSGATRVAVDVSTLLRAGDRWELHNVQDLWGAPVASGIHRGAPLVIPLRGVEPPPPLGRRTPNRAPRTGPLFDAFLLTVRAGVE